MQLKYEEEAYKVEIAVNSFTVRGIYVCMLEFVCDQLACPSVVDKLNKEDQLLDKDVEPFH